MAVTTRVIAAIIYLRIALGSLVSLPSAHAQRVPPAAGRAARSGDREGLVRTLDKTTEITRRSKRSKADPLLLSEIVGPCSLRV